jgi:type I restriction enzyme, S subunit
MKPGYKQTEVGVIPEEWEVKPLGELASLYQPVTISAKQFAEAGYPVYGPNGVVGFYHSTNHQTWQVTVTCRGSTCGTVNRTVDECWITGNAMVLNCDQNKDISKDFFYYLLLGQDMSVCITGTGQPQIVRSPLSAFRVAVPKRLPEQRAIAAALSDMDALLASLDRLIAKKRDLKQAAMQQLLTGQTRLPGFTGKWVVKRLGDECSITTGRKDVNEGNPSGEYPFFTCAREHTFSDSFSFEGEAILIAGNGEVGNLSYIKGRFEVYQRTYVLQRFTINVSYLWHQLSAAYLTISLGIGKIGSSIPYILKGNLLEFEFHSPVDVAEQTAIATGLSDMDLELAGLEKRRDKTRALKQGMMQELLTGRTRLV